MSDCTAFSIPYGELERLIANSLGTTPALVRSRFRKLRNRPFPDDIRSGTGVKVQYNLRRAIALATTFQLNNLYIPQGHAVGMVEAVWPELCRAFIFAANQIGLLSRLEGVPTGAGRFVEIGCAAVSAGEALSLDAATVSDIDVGRLSIRPAIALDAGSFLEALASWAAERGPLARDALIGELVALERDYGWCRPRAASADFLVVATNTSFLEDGPYLDRANILLEATPVMFDAKAKPAARLRLQSIYDYLVCPAPVDAIKSDMRLSKDGAPLSRYLHFYARDMGLDTHGTLPESWNLEDAQTKALELIARALSG